MAVITCIEDLRVLARRRVPRMFYDYADAGSWTESTYRANTDDFASIRFRQRVAVNMDHRTLATKMLGENVAMPVALAPIGALGMQRADGEILAARAAEKFGVPFVLSTMSICSIEDVAANVTRPFWFQLYVMRDRDFIARLDRSREGGRLFRTRADTRPADSRTTPQGFEKRHDDAAEADAAQRRQPRTKPRWCCGHARDSTACVREHRRPRTGIGDMSSLSAWTARQFDPNLNWDDVQWIKERWGGKLVLKGIMDAEDARLAVSSGADALIVSNHGGRQLDGAPSSIRALPAIVAAVGRDIEVWVDGGIRSGQDVIRALALGAKGTLIGRALSTDWVRSAKRASPKRCSSLRTNST